jgi:zinc protease
MRRLFGRVLVLSLLSFPYPARAEPLALPDLPVETVTLSNGLRVLLAPDPRATLTSVVVLYEVGSADDPDGKRGLAHLTEHLVAEWTKHVPDAFLALAAAGAANANAHTGADVTTYEETVPPERLETALWVESDRMGFAAEAVTDDRVAREIPVIANEQRDRQDLHVASVAAALAQHSLFPPWHPYVALFDDANDRPNAADVRAFLATWYTPRNASLTIAGRFDREATLALVRRYFEPIPGFDAVARPQLPPFAEDRATGLTVAANAFHDEVLLSWRTPRLGEPDDAALDLVALALSGPGNTRLSRSLVTADLASSVFARQQSFRHASVFYVAVECEPGVDPRAVVANVERSIDDLVHQLEPGEVARARAAQVAMALARMETTSSRAAVLAGAGRPLLGGAPASLAGLERYASIGRDDVAAAAGRWLAPTRAVTMVVYADRTASRAGELRARTERGR